MISYNTLIVLAGGSLLGASAGLVGCFAILRGRALVGDALAHAALPGVCLAFLVAGQRSLPPLLCGALASGLAGIWLIALLRRHTRIKEDAAIGLVLSVFFGVGIALERMIQNQSASGAKAGLDSFLLGKTAGMLLADVYLIAAVSLLCLATIGLLYKEFKLVTFDEGFARAQGWPVLGLDLALMVLVALAVVIGLPSVGAVLVAALLILPGSAARFWTDRLGWMLALAAMFGAWVGLAGVAASATFSKLPAGPIIVLVGAATFLASLALAPERGLAAGYWRWRQFKYGLDQRQLLRVLYEVVEQQPPAARIKLDDLLARKSWKRGDLQRRLRRAERAGQLRVTDGAAIALSAVGRRQAALAARKQRLWELFWVEYPDVAASLVDLDEQTLNTAIPAELMTELIDELQSRGRWPVVEESP